MKPYLLMIMEPDNDDAVLKDFQSELPFGAIAAGERLDLSQCQNMTGKPVILSVKRVEHKLSEDLTGKLCHVVRVTTKDENPESVYDVLDRIDGKQKPAESAQSDAEPVQASVETWSPDVLADVNHPEFAEHKRLFDIWQAAQDDDD